MQYVVNNDINRFIATLEVLLRKGLMTMDQRDLLQRHAMQSVLSKIDIDVYSTAILRYQKILILEHNSGC